MQAVLERVDQSISFVKLMHGCLLLPFVYIRIFYT
jgi:hypothetical protein